jgi:hypothetical protein
MKIIFAICGLVLLVGGVLLWQYMRLPDHFGEFTGAPKADVTALVANPTEYLHKTVTIEGVVAKQCTTMGCYFFFVLDKGELRIDLADIAMNAPRRNGHRVKVEGQIVPYNDGYQFWASAVEFYGRSELGK